MIKLLLALWGGLMGAFTGGCLLALFGAWLASELYGNPDSEPAMVGASLGGFASAVTGSGVLGGFAGAVLGFGLGLWLVLRKGGHWGGTAVTGLTGVAIMVAVSLGYVAFSQ